MVLRRAAGLDAVETLAVRGAKSLRVKLETHRDDALRSRRLATVDRDVPGKFEVDGLRWPGADPAVLTAFAKQWGLGGLADRVRHLQP